MKKTILFFMVGLLLFACSSEKQQPVIQEQKLSDQVFQYSLFTALANSIYDGNFTVAEVKENGDLGLGTYNGLNGEMIVCNGKVYQCLADGTVRQPDNSELVPFTVLKFFEADKSLTITDTTTYPEMKNMIENKLSSANFIYAFKISGTFEYLKCGSADKQEKPYTNTLSEAIAERPTFEWENITGTMVGFWFPEYVGGVNIPGFHLHFISGDEQKAGHVLEFRASNLEIGIDMSSDFQFVLPETGDFKTKVFDLSQGYNK
jgi:acetolactate decarboxylase